MCHCGSEVSKGTVRIDNEKCKISCPGLPSTVCGGDFGWWNIFSTDGPDQATEATETTEASSGADMITAGLFIGPAVLVLLITVLHYEIHDDPVAEVHDRNV